VYFFTTTYLYCEPINIRLLDASPSRQRSFGLKAAALQADRADTGAGVGAAARRVRELGGIDILVNHAGNLIALRSLSLEDLDRTLAVAVKEQFLVVAGFSLRLYKEATVPPFDRKLVSDSELHFRFAKPGFVQ
jgi:NAD(P)-dependent dehydrogenase (short-subunit alcohol dehydrogenase family)